jgi:hypothetical protein
VLVVLTLVATAGFLYRPAVLLGVDGRALADSVAAEAGGSETFDECRERGSSRWRCLASDGSNAARYDVEVDGRGCWTARRLGEADRRDRVRARTSGCIGVLDYVHVAD